MSDDVISRRLRDGYPFARRPAPDRSAVGSPTGLPSSARGLLPDHAAAANDIPGVLGPRGRDESGQHVHVETGRPPAQEPGAWGWEHLVGKDERRPVIPPQVERYANVNVAATTGKLLDRAAGFTWRTMQIDNYSAQWLYVPAADRYLGPFVCGAQWPVPTGSSKVEVDAGAPPGITQNALASTTQIFSVTVIEDEREYSPGIAINIPGTSTAIGISGSVAIDEVPTAVITRVASSATDVTLIAANTAREGLFIFNESTQTLVISFGVASGAIGTGPYTAQIPSNQFYEMPLPIYTGAIHGQWVSANGAAQVTELSGDA